MDVPNDIVVFAVNVEDILTLNEKCTEKVEKVIPKVVKMITKEVMRDA